MRAGVGRIGPRRGCGDWEPGRFLREELPGWRPTGRRHPEKGSIFFVFIDREHIERSLSHYVDSIFREREIRRAPRDPREADLYVVLIQRVQAGPRRKPYVACFVYLDAFGNSIFRCGEQTPIGQEDLSVLAIELVFVHVPWAVGVDRTVADRVARVGDVDRLFIVGERDAVRPAELTGEQRERAGRGVVQPDPVPESRRWTESLPSGWRHGAQGPWSLPSPDRRTR